MMVESPATAEGLPKAALAEKRPRVSVISYSGASGVLMRHKVILSLSQVFKSFLLSSKPFSDCPARVVRAETAV